MSSPDLGSLEACLATLDPDPSRAGFEFEPIAAWWLRTDPEWSSNVKTVWLAKEWPGRSSGQDLGTDLVVELVDGGLMAVQVKRRQKVTTAEIDSFLADTVDRFDERMLIATTDDIATHGRTKLRQAHAHVIARADLDASPVVWPTGGDLATGHRLQPREARPHQAAAVADALGALETHDRCRVVMACGSGKTLAAQRLAEAVAPDGLVVVAVPSLSLLAQTLASWARDSAVGFDDWLAVCSDSTVADAPDTSEMPSVTTDASDVTAWLRRDASRGQQVVLVTHASMPVVADALTRSRRSAALLVVDEAHRVAGRGALARLATGDFPTEKRVFLTATPRIYTAATKAKADGAGVEVISMDDEARFGPEAHHLSFGNAVELGLLVDFEIVVSIITDTDIHRLVTDRVIAELAGVKADTATLAAHIAVARALHEWDAKRTISFHTRIAQAHDFAAHHQALAHLVVPDETVIAESTSGKVPAGQRKAALDRLATLHGGADRRLLANARVLSEGVDIPAVDAVAFIDPRRSVIDIAQAVGRAMRTSPSKKRGLVVVPVHLSKAYEAAVDDDQSWRPVWDTLRALRSIDERLAEELDQYRYQLGRRTSPAEPLIRLHLLSVEPLDAAFVESVTAQAVRLTSPAWNEWFGLLETYADAQGDTRVPQGYVTDDGHRLGQWVGSQRLRRKRGDLSPEQTTRLEALPGWVWDTNEAAWEEAFARLEAYVAEHGHARPARGERTPDGYPLGRWVTKQRTLRNRGELSPERQERLESIQGWLWDPWDADWEEGYAHLEARTATYGTASVPHGHIADDGYRLGGWVTHQRQSHRKGQLDADREARLDALPGWLWDPYAAAWEEAFTALKAYVAEHGNARPPLHYRSPDGFRVGQWVVAIRSRRRTLSPERQARLEALPGWVWHTQDAAWEDGFVRLEAYVSEYGTARPQDAYTTHDGYKLGHWVRTQRRKRSTLTTDRKERLERLHGWSWSITDAAWEQGFAALEAYCTEHGTARPPATYMTDGGFRLGGWTTKQRRIHATGKLSAERARRLERLPGWVWHTQVAAWEDGFVRLEAYVSEYGTARPTTDYVTDDGHRLGSWVATQRRFHKNGTLKRNRAERLESLPGWAWDPYEVDWEEAFARLQAYVAENGTALVPGGHVTADGFALGSWAKTQRQARRKGWASLSQGRQARLEALQGWVWVARSES